MISDPKKCKILLAKPSATSRYLSFSDEKNGTIASVLNKKSLNNMYSSIRPEKHSHMNLYFPIKILLRNLI